MATAVAPASKSLADVIKTFRQQFEAVAQTHENAGSVVFAREATFALQILQGGTKENGEPGFLEKIARQNVPSLRAAVVNVATVGLTLNPVLGQAYLVPRKGKVCLDIGAQGFVELALRTGRIRTIHYDLVYEKDVFEAPSPGHFVIHRRNSFADRGALLGGYCQPVMADGSAGPCVTLTAEEIRKRRESSDGWKAHHVGGKNGKSQSCVWCDWPEEMAKKTLLRAARRTWPQTPALDRADAISTLADAGVGATAQELADAAVRTVDGGELCLSAEQIATINRMAEAAELPLEVLRNAYGVERIEDIAADRFEDVLAKIEGFVATKDQA